MTPHQFASLSPKKATDILSGYIGRQSKNVSGGTLANVKKAVVSWMGHNGRTLQRDIAIHGIDRRVRAQDWPVPTQEELRRVFNAATPYQRVAVAAEAFLGVRPETIGFHKAVDGLRLGDIVDFDVKTLKFTNVPALVIVRPEINKTRKRHRGFFPREGCDILEAALQLRRERGEALDKDSPWYASSWYRGHDKGPVQTRPPHVGTGSVTKSIKQAMKAAGLGNLPPGIIWRSYFETQTMRAQAEGLTTEMRDHFMGHAGSMGGRYSFDKILRENSIEDLRNAYAKAAKYLETTTPRNSNDETRWVKFIEAELRILGATTEEIAKMHLALRTHDELMSILNDARLSGIPNVPLPAAPLPRAAPPAAEVGRRREIVTLEVSKDLGTKGWDVLHEYADGTVLMIAPGVQEVTR